MRSIRIRSITERHSLFPRSYTRTPCRLALRLAYHLQRGERYGLTTFHVSDNNGLGLSYPPAVIMSVQPHLDRELTDCTPFWFKPTASFWSEALNIIWLVLRNDVYQTFTLVDHTIKSRPSAERCYLPLTSTRAWVYSFSERVLCQSSFAQRDYSLCTYSQTTANGIAGVINELNHSHTITYTAYPCHTSGSKYCCLTAQSINIRRTHHAEYKRLLQQNLISMNAK